MKAKCKVSKVQFNDKSQVFQDSLSVPPSYGDNSRNNRQRFLKFIEKNKHESILRSIIDTQIQSNKDKKNMKNETEILKISKFETMKQANRSSISNAVDQIQ